MEVVEGKLFLGGGINASISSVVLQASSSNGLVVLAFPGALPSPLPPPFLPFVGTLDLFEDRLVVTLAFLFST